MRRTVLACLFAMLLLPIIGAAKYHEIGELDAAAIFSFAIMSDNKGDSPYSKVEFARMVEWINQSGDAFVIGLGDHVKKDWENDFLSFLRDNEWWHRWFYPNVADGENEYYGEGQGDWGAGAPILSEVELGARSEVVIRDNGAEYYAKIMVEGYTVHLIQLTFADTPSDPRLAFTEDSRRYLVDTLNAINKGDRDIVVVGAHSIWGSWIDVLSKERLELVMEKADLILSATTHYYTRIIPPGYAYMGGLCLNTGSITHPSGGSDPGYLQVHVLENPLRLVIHYHDVRNEERTIRCGRYSYVKDIGGIIVEDVCTYDPFVPTCWPEDPWISSQMVVQGEIYTVTCRTVFRSDRVVPDVTINLSKIGGGSLSMFDDGSHGDKSAGDGVFSLSTQMSPDAPLGTHDLTLTMQHGGGTTEAKLLVTVYPAGDYQIFSDQMHTGWVAEEMGSAELSPSNSNPYGGLACQNLTLDRGGSVRYRYLSQSGFPTSGFKALVFRVRPVALSPDKVFIQGSGEAGSRTISLKDLGVPLLDEEWALVRVPLESIGINGTSLSYLRIYSIGPANFYLDDLAMTTDVPQTLLHLLALTLAICIFRMATTNRTSVDSR